MGRRFNEETLEGMFGVFNELGSSLSRQVSWWGESEEEEERRK